MDVKMKKVHDFEGQIAAVFTPFKGNGALNLEAIGPYAKYLEENGVKGIYLSGTTGEFLALTLDERKQLLEKWLSEGKNRLDLIIAHVYSGCMTETKKLAKHAYENGVDCIAVLPPLYYKPSDNNELISYLSEISAAAPDTPLMYYHFPAMSGYAVQIASLFPEIKKSVPNFVGGKYTSNDLKDAAVCRAKHKNQFKIMLGSDELQLNALVSGINSSVLISSNLFPSLNTAIHKAYQEKDIASAQANQNKLILSFDAILKHGSFFPAFKATMNVLTTIDVGPTRQPLLPIKDVSALKKDLSQMNFDAV